MVVRSDPPCPWDEYVCSEAAENGHLEILQWLRAQDPPCPWHILQVSLIYAQNGIRGKEKMYKNRDMSNSFRLNINET